jgi:hypothetical protein
MSGKTMRRPLGAHRRTTKRPARIIAEGDARIRDQHRENCQLSSSKSGCIVAGLEMRSCSVQETAMMESTCTSSITLSN